MRTKDKIRTIRSVVNAEDQIEIESTEVLNGTEYRIENWRQVSKALALIIEDGLMVHGDINAHRYISEMIATRGETANGVLLLQADQFHQFVQYVNDYTGELPNVIPMLELISPGGSDAGEGREEFEFAVEVNIGEAQSIDDTRQKLSAVLDLFGKFLTLDQQVKVKGFDTGSDWLIFDAVNEFQSEFIGLVVSCATEVIRELADRPKDYWRLMAKVVGDQLGKSDATTDVFISEAVEKFTGELRNQKVSEALSHLKDIHRGDLEKLHSLNEGEMKARMAVDLITALHSNGVKIQIPEKIAININIEVNGDNNVVELPPIPQIALPPEIGNGEDEEEPVIEDAARDD